MNVRDGTAEVIRDCLRRLGRINRNEVNDEEQIEAIVADVMEDMHLLLRSLETVGAATNPLAELDSRVLQLHTGLLARQPINV